MVMVRAALIISLMKYVLLILFVLSLAVSTACSSSQRAQTKVQRKPLEKQGREYKTPTDYQHREFGYDRKTGKVLTYDHRPRVELMDQRAGKYTFKWIGYDGKEKSVIFQRGDVIDVVVTASVSKTESGAYVYTYDVQNLSTSGSYLTTFAVQNHSAAVTPESKNPLVALTMSSAIYKFKEGNWLSFNDASDYVQINPGQSVRIQLMSSAPPGLVTCSAVGGPMAIDGAGEEMPSALANLLPGYDEWPSGSTIGPVDRLKGISADERINYLSEQLPLFQKAGWITQEAFNNYQELVNKRDLNSLLAQIDHDLKAERITTEVSAIIQAMK